MAPRTYIPFSKPNIGPKEKKELIRSLDSGWITRGPITEKFEKRFHNYIKSPHVIGVNSCTAALHLALLAHKIGPGDEVITTPLTFAATANTILQCRAKPVLVDIRKDTYNIDEQLIPRKINKKTKALLPVHYGGHPCDMQTIFKIAKKRKLAVIEDAAHAVGAEIKGKKIGSVGPATVCFSFYANKNMTTGEGGMLATPSKRIFEFASIHSLHGISQQAWERYTEKGKWYYEITHLGYKYNMADPQAALGLHQLTQLDGFIREREKISRQYNRAFKGEDALICPKVMPEVRHARHLYPLLIRLKALRIKRNQFIEALRKKRIGASVHFIPLPYHPFYRKNLGFRLSDYPNCKWFWEREISLPLFPGLKEKEVNFVIETVLNLVKKYRR